MLIPRFFKDMPPKDKRHTKGQWQIQVLALFPMKENIVYTGIVDGPLWLAYVKVRLRALWKDIDTQGEGYGIGWRVQKNVTLAKPE